MVIFQNSIFLFLFDSLTIFSISVINQSAYSVHSPMLNYFLLNFISHSSNKKCEKDDLAAGCPTRVGRFVVKMLITTKP